MTSPTLSWGRFPRQPQQVDPVPWRGDMPEKIRDLVLRQQTSLPFGCGRSYGDSCLAFSGRLLGMRALDKFISADWESGWIIAEAGVTLAEILRLSIPQGWFLPVTPGTKYVTLGGAVANDVHGKNHHIRGTFGCIIAEFGLYRSDLGEVVCSLEQHPELFAATIGGLGVTGVITWVALKLLPINASSIRTQFRRFADLQEFLAISAEFDQRHEYAVAWVDCTAPAPSLGRGLYILGDHAASGELSLPSRKKLSMPLVPPFSLVNSVTIPIFNTLYFYRQPKAWRYARVDHDSFFYPLDGLLNWNRMYGPQGFHQFQCVIPESSAENALKEILREISRNKSGSFLAVLKRCGDLRSPGLLSFPLPGTSLALDFANQPANRRLLAALDEIVVEAGGRLYPAKDAHMKGEHFRKFYPAWQQVEQLRDPVLKSSFWHRVTT